MKKHEISLLIGLIFSLIITYCTDVNVQAEKIRNTTLRLHIISQDNSVVNQDIKIQVKDEIVKLCEEILCPAQNFNQAVELAKENLSFIETATNYKLQQIGANYSAVCSIENFHFDTTEYNDFTMPRGNYAALTVRLGKAEGKNWWCVVYPGLCSSIGGEYTDDDSNTFIETDKYRIKFKTIELWENLKSKLNINNTPAYKN